MSKKTIFIIVGLVILLLFIVFLSSTFNKKEANKENVKIIIGESKFYSSEELNDAIRTVIDTFNFPATLDEIWYDEEKSQSRSQELSTRFNSNDIIVLFCDFTTYSNTGVEIFMPGCLNSNSKYQDYEWILIRNKEGIWEIQSQGY